MANRGPDAEGIWMSEDGRLGFGHRRLSIIDLSAESNQPLVDHTGRFRIIFNGEIFNYQELRDERLQAGYPFRTHSDTEVILALFERSGPEAFKRLRGMFGLAIWDSKLQQLTLARDALGIKPLYIADDGKTIRFASQVRALSQEPEVDTSPEPAGHIGFLVLGHMPEPLTLYKGIRSLASGTYLQVDAAGHKNEEEYYDVRRWLLQKPRVGTREELREALLDSVKHHFVSDVPVSMFLSAGKDSTTLLGLAAESNQSNLHTVTLGFSEYKGTGDDETELAAKVAAQYGSKHENYFVEREEFKARMDDIFTSMDQPSIDGANTYFVCSVAASKGVKVALSGLGADEVFGGYPSFRQVPKLARTFGWAKSIPGLGRGVRRLAETAAFGRSPKWAGLLEYGSTIERAFLLRRAVFMPWEVSRMVDPEFFETGWESLNLLGKMHRATCGMSNAYSKVAMLELTRYMQNRLLRDSDWASMASSLELRVPFVDVKFLEALGPWVASDRPPTKEDMTACLSNPLPSEVLTKPKTGFNIPVAQWSAQEQGPSAEIPMRRWARTVYRKFGGGEFLNAK